MDFVTIVLRTVFLYFVILVTFRIMGKREIGQLSILDFVVSIMIAELAVISIESLEKPMSYSLVAIGVLLAIQVFFSIISLKSQKAREILDGKPSIIIDRGQIDENEMRKQRYNFDDLMAQLREKDVSRVSDVEFAILESSGELSVVKKNEDEDTDYQFPLPLIVDGKVQENHLERIKKTPLWLRQELRKIGYKELKKISFCTVDKDGVFYVDTIDDRK